MPAPLPGTPQGGSSAPGAIAPPQQPPSATSGQLSGGDNGFEALMAEFAAEKHPAAALAAAGAVMPAGIVAGVAPPLQAPTQAASPLAATQYAAAYQAAAHFGQAGLMGAGLLSTFSIFGGVGGSPPAFPGPLFCLYHIS